MSKQARFSSFLASLGLSAAAPAIAASAPQPAPAADDEQGGQAPDNQGEMVASADAERAVSAALEKGKIEGFKAAQDRMVSVMASDAGKAQPAAAVSLMARAPDMSAEDVIATLADIAPAPAAEAARTGPAAVGADLKDTPKPAAGAAANDGDKKDEVDSVSLWDGVQGTKNGVKIGRANG